MADRTTETTVTFAHSFSLSAVDGIHPAGTYRLVTEEDAIQGLSFLAFRRVATLLHVPAVAASGGWQQVFPVDATELAAALEADGRH